MRLRHKVAVTRPQEEVVVQKTLIAVAITVAGAAAAQDWVLQDDAGITAALGDKTVVYDAYTLQTFDAAGTTQFVTERAADGRWTARRGQYCSTWPPSAGWDCYDVYLSGNQVRFVGKDKSESVGLITN